MDNLQTISFDEILKSKIKHFNNYPEMLPFIGNEWEKSKKILLIGESHYLPYDEIKSYSDFDFNKNWYDGQSSILDAKHKKYITTRNNLITVESGIYEKPLALYFNLRKALLELTELKNSKIVFDKFSFYNYFQKPAYVMEINNEDRSIKPSDLDKKIAYDIFKRIIEVIEPNIVIFVSKKSFNSFNQLNSSRGDFKDLKIDFVPHAGRPWWNKISKSYGNRTGKQKFIDIIKNTYLP